MGTLDARALVAFGLVAASLGCDLPCEFRILIRLSSQESSSVGCCGAVAVEDVVVSDQDDLAIDLAQVAIRSQQGGQDLFLTGPDCDRLFDGPYPAPGTGAKPTPRCPVILGPIAPGRVSPRADVSPGRYRVFVQAYDTNRATNAYRFDVGVWGASCGASPVGP